MSKFRIQGLLVKSECPIGLLLFINWFVFSIFRGFHRKSPFVQVSMVESFFDFLRKIRDIFRIFSEAYIFEPRRDISTVFIDLGARQRKKNVESSSSNIFHQYGFFAETTWRCVYFTYILGTIGFQTTIDRPCRCWRAK